MSLAYFKKNYNKEEKDNEREIKKMIKEESAVKKFKKEKISIKRSLLQDSSISE